MQHPGHLKVDAFGVTVSIEFDGAFPESLADQVRSAWDGAVIEGKEVDLTIALTESAPDTLLEGLSSRVTLDALKHRSGELMMFHAAGISTEDGKVLAFVGPSGRGKTTLSRILGKHYGYVSDETISVSDDLTVFPYRKPLSLKREDQPKLQVSPTEAGLGELPNKPLQLSRLVILNRDKLAENAEFELLPLHEAIADLLTESSYLTHLDRPLQRIASLCERTGGIIRLNYAEAKSLPSIADSLFAFESEMAPWQPVFEANSDVADEHPPPGESEGRIFPGQILDAIETDGHVIVLTEDSMLRVLSGVGPEIWNAARQGLTLSQTVDALVQQHGVPLGADPWTLIEPIIADLKDAKILRQT